MADKLTVGIDLGTSSCSVGIIRDEQFTIFKDDKGNETTPSYVAFTESGRLIGQEAKDQVTINPKNTVYGIKRLIGKHHNKVMEEGRKLKLPFHASLHNSNSHIPVEYKRRNKLLEPKQVSAMLLVKMRKIAERNLGQNVHGAVISVPANFNSYQRQATVDAATIAGFKEINLINEPTASAFAFCSKQKCEKYRNVLIADFGGGFFSLTVARVKSYDVQILASCAEDFGGIDIDQQLFDRFAKEISANLFSNVGNQRCTERLKQVCEAAKKDLSHSSSRIHLTNFIDGKDVHLKVTKSDFITEVNASVGNMFHIATQKVLREACVWNCRIEDIVFVGNSWNISYLKESFLSFFSAQKIPPCIHNMTNSVLHGAAIQAVGRTINFRLEDTIRSVEIHRKHGARMLSLVPNALSQRQEWIDLEESVECNVIEVVRNIRHQRENNTIGKIEVGPRKGYNFLATTAAYVQIYADANGILQGGLENKRAKFINLNLFHFSHRIDTLLSQEVQFQAEEIEAQKLEEELRHLEKQCLETRRLVRNCNNLPLEMKERFDRRIEETLRWIDDNPGAMEVESRSKKLEIQKIYDEAQESEKSMVNGKCQRKGQENSGHQVNSTGSLQSQVSISRKNNRCNSVLSQIAGSSKYSDNAQKEKLLHLSDKERQEIKATLNGKQEEQRNDNPSECKEKVVNESIDQYLASDKQKEVKSKKFATVCSRISSTSRNSIEEIEISKKNENNNGTSDNLKDKQSYLSSEKEQTPLGTRTNSTNSAMKSSNISNDYNNSSSPADGRFASNSSSSDRDLISSSQKVISEPRVDPSASAIARGNTSAKSHSLQKEKNHVTDVNQNYNGDAVPSEPQKCDSKSISEQKDLEGVKEVQSIKREGYLDGSGSERSCSSESYSTASKPRKLKGKCIKLKNGFIAYPLMDKGSSYCYKAYSQFFCILFELFSS